MKSKILLILLVSLLTVPFPVNCQKASGTRDKYTLLTMPYIQRPLNLYKGQLQANAGYKFAMRSRSFDSNGDVIKLKDDGNSSMLHYYFLELKYGILDFVEMGAEITYSKKGIRSETMSFGSPTYLITETYLNEFKGMGDLFLFASVRLPFEYKKVDFRLSGGVFLPTANHEPEKPTHTVTDYLNALSYTINYHFNEKNGYGIALWQASAEVKFAFSKFGAEVGFSFRDPLKEGENFRWDETLSGQTFSYTSASYSYLPHRMIDINASLHYQPNGWFNIYLGSDYVKFFNGWTEFWGLKYSNPEISLMMLEPGYEIVVSPSFRISQTIGFSLFGENSDAPFSMITTLSYNIFPFKK
ncbi:MAG: hypothetical protein MUF36_02885 [Bacteroidales bacterium]|nr:hypothetical protein [Bacteroidales bacterium]